MTRWSFSAALVLAVALSLPADSNAQLSGVENGEWRYLGGDAGHMRPNPHLTQIHAENVSELEVSWIWRSSIFGAGGEYTSRSAEPWRGRERHTPTTGTTVAAW